MSMCRTGKGFWGLLTDPERDALSDLGGTKNYQPRETVCGQGDPATHLFVLITGWVKIISVTADGRERVVALRGHGDVIGEISGETTGQRTATVKAIDAVHALLVPYERFGSFLDSHPRADRAYRRVMIQRWSQAAAMVSMLPVTTGAQRLAALLVDLAAEHGNEMDGRIHVEMPLSQGELGNLATTSRATVTRALKDWRKRRIIQTSQRHITVLDLQALEKVVGQQKAARPAR
jgi:CRP/FNR family transcriptional regulator, cyclic AMP receptor protein